MATNTPTTIFPIQSPNKLAWLLHVKRSELEALANTAGGHYRSFDILKIKDDGTKKWRHIDNPDESITPTHQAIYRHLLRPLAPDMPDYLTGGMPGKSIIDNAYPHLGQPAIVTLDIRNCFPSINHGMVFKVWREKLGASDSVASILTKLTTLQNRLPQGSTASPIICNLVLSELAAAIDNYASANRLVYTQYVDDITLSGNADAVRKAIEVLIPLVASYGLKLGRGKIVIMDSNELQRTTGLKVNSGLTLPSKKISEMRTEIMRLHSLGNQAKTYEFNSLWGKLNYFKSVDPTRGGALFKFGTEKLVGLSGTYADKPHDITRVCRDYGNKH